MSRTTRIKFLSRYNHVPWQRRMAIGVRWVIIMELCGFQGPGGCGVVKTVSDDVYGFRERDARSPDEERPRAAYRRFKMPSRARGNTGSVVA